MFFRFRHFAAVAILACLNVGVAHVGAASAQTCDRWTEYDFLSQASLAQARSCIALQDDWGVTDAYGNTPLTAAVQHDRPDVVRAMIDAGVDVNIAGVNDYTPLHWAVMTGSKALVVALLDAGADVNHRDGDQKTALHQAVEVDFEVEIIPLLLAARADPTALDKYGQTPVHSLLGRNPNVAALRMVMAAGFDAAYVDPKYRYSYLHWAVNSNNAEKIAVILDAGVDTRLKNHDGKTAADMAEGKAHLSEIYARLRQGEWVTPDLHPAPKR